MSLHIDLHFTCIPLQMKFNTVYILFLGVCLIGATSADTDDEDDDVQVEVEDDDEVRVEKVRNTAVHVHLSSMIL